MACDPGTREAVTEGGGVGWGIQELQHPLTYMTSED